MKKYESKTSKKIKNVFLIIGDADAGKTSLIKKLLNGKYNTRKPMRVPLIGGGFADVFCPRSQAEQESRVDPNTCCLNIKKISVKFSLAIDVVIVLRLNHKRWPSMQYVNAIIKAGYNIKATVVLDTVQNCPNGAFFPNSVFLGRINVKRYKRSLNQLYIATKKHFGWL